MYKREMGNCCTSLKTNTKDIASDAGGKYKANTKSSNDVKDKSPASSNDLEDVTESGLIQWNTTTPFVPPITEGTVIKVYDGDTITVAAKLPYSASPLYRFSVRLNGIDTPELKTNNEIEKKVAIMARDALHAKIYNRKVSLVDVQTEKYGRVLCIVKCDGVNMNEWMVDQRFAVKYDGGTKKSPSNWLEFHEGEK